MKGVSFIVFVLFLFAGVAFGAYQWENEFSSTDDDSAPSARYHHTFAVVGGVDDDGVGVLAGGFSFYLGGTHLSDTWLYDVANRTWSKGADLPSARAYFTSNAYEGDIVVFGGEGVKYYVHGDLLRYSLETDTWTNETFSKWVQEVRRQYHASDIIGDKLYAFGGHVNSYDRTSNSLISYDFITKEWNIEFADQKSGPPGRQGHSLHAYEDPAFGPSLIIFGGYSDNPYTSGFNDVWQYIIAKGIWINITITDTPKSPDGRYGHDSILIEDTLLVFGGMSTQNITTPPTYDLYYGDVWSLKLYGNGVASWTQELDFNNEVGARQGHQSVNIGEILYTTAGYVQFKGLTNDVWSLQLQ